MLGFVLIDGEVNALVVFMALLAGGGGIENAE